MSADPFDRFNDLAKQGFMKKDTKRYFQKKASADYELEVFYKKRVGGDPQMSFTWKNLKSGQNGSCVCTLVGSKIQVHNAFGFPLPQAVKNAAKMQLQEI